MDNLEINQELNSVASEDEKTIILDEETLDGLSEEQMNELNVKLIDLAKHNDEDKSDNEVKINEELKDEKIKNEEIKKEKTKNEETKIDHIKDLKEDEVIVEDCNDFDESLLEIVPVSRMKSSSNELDVCN